MNYRKKWKQKGCIRSISTNSGASNSTKVLSYSSEGQNCEIKVSAELWSFWRLLGHIVFLSFQLLEAVCISWLVVSPSRFPILGSSSFSLLRILGVKLDPSEKSRIISLSQDRNLNRCAKSLLQVR